MQAIAKTDTGSKNGIAVGYFLAQHKQQLGDKYVTKITLFQEEGDGAPHMLFWVADSPPNPPPLPELRPPQDDPMDTDPGNSGVMSESRVVRRSADKKSVLREHVFRARL
jgi:hypothetical protein